MHMHTNIWTCTQVRTHIWHWKNGKAWGSEKVVCQCQTSLLWMMWSQKLQVHQPGVGHSLEGSTVSRAILRVALFFPWWQQMTRVTPLVPCLLSWGYFQVTKEMCSLTLPAQNSMSCQIASEETQLGVQIQALSLQVTTTSLPWEDTFNT